MVSFAGLGTVVSRSDDLPPGGSVHQETNVELNAPLAPGWVRATCYRAGEGQPAVSSATTAKEMPTGEAGINAATVPATRFVTFAEQGEGQSGTGVAYANPSDTTTAFVTFTVQGRGMGRRWTAASFGPCCPNGHDAQNMVDLFDLGSFSRIARSYLHGAHRQSVAQ